MILYKKNVLTFKHGGILANVNKLSKEAKTLIQPHLNSSSKYKKGMGFGLSRPDGMDPGSKGLGFGADKDGFFIHTHRARSKSRKDPLKFAQKEIKFIKSTG
jgi:hypothetical protein